MAEEKKETKKKKEQKKTNGTGKVIIEGDFVNFKAGEKCHARLVSGKVYNVTAEKARLYINAGWGEIVK